MSYKSYQGQLITTTWANFGEVYYALLKGSTEEAANKALEKVQFQFLELTKEVVKEAMKWRHQQKTLKFSYIDCFGYMLAKHNNMLFLTGDQAFENFDNIEFVK